LWVQKLNQQPAVTYDMWKRDFIIKRNKVNTNAAVDTIFVALLFSSFKMSGIQPFQFEPTYPPNE